jgi:phospholipid transport system substrate-binding protein
MRKEYLPYLVALTLLSLLHAAVFASESPSKQGGTALVSNAAIDDGSPAELIENTVQRVLTRLDGDPVPAGNQTAHLHAVVKDMVVPHLDMPRIARIVLGKYGRKVSHEQLKEFTAEFQTLLVRTYATSLMAYRGGRIDVSQTAQPSAKGTASVGLRVYRADSAPIEISFLIHNRSGPWLVYDLRVEGISLVGNYRSEFTSILRNQGVEGLITNLKNRNRRAFMAARD